ncbi:hypothetical protein K2X33_14255 [bacterium]|nr:hypothetical protein [bacterium]
MSFFLALYLKVGVSLALSYVLARAAERFLLRQDAFARLRALQGVFLLGLVGPLYVALIPKQVEVVLPEAIRAPLAETVGKPQLLLKAPASEKAAEENFSPTASLQWEYFALAFLLLGGMLHACRLRLELQRLGGLLRESTLLRRVGRVRVVASDSISIPFSTLRSLSAWVVLPAEMLGNGMAYRVAVWHELQHHRQRDTHWAMGLELFGVAFFWNPAVRAWRELLCRHQELACDQAVLRKKISARNYALCLLEVAERSLEVQNLVACAGMANHSFLRRRIEMLSCAENKSVWRVWFLVSLGAALTLGSAYAARQVGDETTEIVSTEPGVQAVAEKALRSAMQREKATLGLVVVADSKTGKILAVANEDRSGKRPEGHWSLGLKLGPASLVKPLIASAAVEKGRVAFNEELSCEDGHYEWDGRVYKDWKPFHKLTVAETIVQSSNICGVKVGRKLGAAGVAEAFHGFGFHTFAEPSQAPESLYVGQLAIGYDGITASPLEIVRAYGAIANGGLLLGSGGEHRVLSEKTAQQTREALVGVVERGTGKPAASALYHLAGKTGTGYGPNAVGTQGKANLAAFAGFGPVESPRVVVFAALENPGQGKGVHGGGQAGPLFKEVAEKTLQHLRVPTL